MPVPELQHLQFDIDPEAKRVFHEIAGQRRARPRQLVRRLADAGFEIGREQLTVALNRLKQKNLIREGNLGLPQEMRTYYLTADGLSLERAMDRLGRS